MGPAWNGRAYTDGNGTPPSGEYLNALWTLSQQGLPKALASATPADEVPANGILANAHPESWGYSQVKAVTNTTMREQIRTWRVSAVVAVAKPGSPLGQYLRFLLGRPAVVTGDVIAWRTSP
jgi:hypothetical protein